MKILYKYRAWWFVLWRCVSALYSLNTTNTYKLLVIWFVTSALFCLVLPLASGGSSVQLLPLPSVAAVWVGFILGVHFVWGLLGGRGWAGFWGFYVCVCVLVLALEMQWMFWTLPAHISLKSAHSVGSLLLTQLWFWLNTEEKGEEKVLWSLQLHTLILRFCFLPVMTLLTCLSVAWKNT